MPLKQIVGHTLTYNETTSGFEVKSWCHTTFWMAPCHREHDVANAVHTALATSVYAKMSCCNLHWSTKRSFLPQVCRLLEAVLLKLHMKLAPGWVLIWVKFDPTQKIRPKVGDGRSFVSGHSFARRWYFRPIIMLANRMLSTMKEDTFQVVTNTCLHVHVDCSYTCTDGPSSWYILIPQHIRTCTCVLHNTR